MRKSFSAKLLVNGTQTAVINRNTSISNDIIRSTDYAIYCVSSVRVFLALEAIHPAEDTQIVLV